MQQSARRRDEPLALQRNVRPRQGRPRLPVVVLAFLAALATTACGALQPLVGRTEFVAASYVPADTWLFQTTSLRPAGSQALNLQTLVTAFTSQPGFANALEILQGTATTSTGTSVDFERDVLPLLDGEVAAAVVGITPGLEPQALVLVRSNQPERLLRLLFPGTQPPIEQAGYKGATFFVAPTERTLGAAYEGWALLAESQQAIQDSIDRIEARGAGGLAANPRFQTALERLPAERLSYVFADLVPIIALARQGLEPEMLDDATLRSLDAANARIAASLSADAGGLDLRFASIREEPMAPRAFPSGNALAAFERLPADTLAAYGGDSLPELLAEWEAAVNTAASTGMTGLPDDFDFSFARLLGGEFAAGLRSGSLAQPGGVPDLDFVTRVSDPAAAAAELDRLDGLFPPKSVETVVVDGQRLKQVQIAPGQQATYGLVGDWLYLTSGDAQHVLAARLSGGLRSNARFQMVQHAIDPDGFSIFADLEGVRVLAESLASPTDLQTYRLLVAPFVTPLRAYAQSWRLEPNGDGSGRIFLAIRR